jgi:hypothetical protein
MPGETEEITNNLSSAGRFPGGDLNPGPPEYVAGMLTTLPRHSVGSLWITRKCLCFCNFGQSLVLQLVPISRNFIIYIVQTFRRNIQSPSPALKMETVFIRDVSTIYLRVYRCQTHNKIVIFTTVRTSNVKMLGRSNKKRICWRRICSMHGGIHTFIKR